MHHNRRNNCTSLAAYFMYGVGVSFLVMRGNAIRDKQGNPLFTPVERLPVALLCSGGVLIYGLYDRSLEKVSLGMGSMTGFLFQALTYNSQELPNGTQTDDIPYSQI